MFDLSNFTPHGFCLAWDPRLIWLQAGSDLLIATAYFSIPFALVRFTRLRRDLAFPWIFRLFAGFIMACGTTHVLGVVTLWAPIYWTDGLVKFVTALLSVGTAVLLWMLLPKALAIPTQKQLQELNARLLVEVGERRAAEERLASIYERSPAPLCAADTEGRVVEVSDQWLELLGYGRDEVTGRAMSAFAAPGTEEQARVDWERLLREGALRDAEQTLMHRDGSARHVLTSARVERGGGLAVTALTDITGRRQTEEALRASEGHLRQAQKMEAVGHLTGGIAHDFNNMLTAITVMMELLNRRLPEEDGSRKLVERVLDVSGRAARLTAQLLAFSRRQRLVAEALDPVVVAREMLPLLTRPVGEQVELRIEDGGAGGWLCLADRNQLESALLNLVLNARAAIDGRGVITIGAVAVPAAESAGWMGLSAGKEPLLVRDYVAISVGDTGGGMTEEVRRQAFEPFFTTKAVGEGSGLGLSQAYGFARQSGGTVRIESTVGVGTRVTIVLPRAVASVQAAAAEGAGVPAVRGNGEVVLVVEDENTLRDVVVTALTELGYRVIPARTGEEAVALLDREERVDVLFTDLMMPGALNGLELAMELRRRWPELPVVFATGYMDRRMLERWPGPLHVMSKPYSIEAVANAIREARMALGG